MSSLLRSAAAAGALYAGVFNPEIAFAQEQPTTTESTTTTETTIPETTTTTLSQEELRARDCGEDDIVDLVQVPIEGTEDYHMVNSKTGTVCGLLNPALVIPENPAPPTEVLGVQVERELPRTGVENRDLATAGFAFLVLGGAVKYAERRRIRSISREQLSRI